VNKANLVEIVGRVVSTRKEALSAVDAMLNAIQHSLRSGDKVVLAGVGSFHVKMRKAKIGRNPKTGQTVPIPPRRAVRFKMSKDLFTNTVVPSYNEDPLRHGRLNGDRLADGHRTLSDKGGEGA
jgi:DNA-binding protein HU-beta